MIADFIGLILSCFPALLLKKVRTITHTAFSDGSVLYQRPEREERSEQKTENWAQFGTKE